ncbi:MAG: membrane integrity-associated transporter subunit PqiC [Gemmatimonadales bacterium]
MRRAVLVGLIGAAGCLSPREDTSAFFLLSPAPLGVPAAAPIDIALGLGPIELPGYLDRSQMVVRLSDNQVALSDADRWAEPLADNLHRTLQEDLAALLPGASFIDYPWHAALAPDHAVAITFRRFEADAAGAVVLDATWRVTTPGRPAEARGTRIEETAAGPGRAEAVAAQSRALARLAEEIAGAVRRAAGR